MTKADSVYNLVVIGTGVAASTVAWKCHSAGWKKIAVIDSRPFGGTCNLRGCDPKKVLVVDFLWLYTGVCNSFSIQDIIVIVDVPLVLLIQ